MAGENPQLDLQPIQQLDLQPVTASTPTPKLDLQPVQSKLDLQPLQETPKVSPIDAPLAAAKSSLAQANKLDLQPVSQTEAPPSPASFKDRLLAAAKSASPFGIGQDISTIGSTVKSAVESHLPEIIAEGQGKPGIMNPDPTKNPLIAGSFLPETQADPGVLGTVRHMGYELARSIASPAGLMGLAMGEPETKSVLLESGEVAPPKPRVKAELDGTFTDLENGNRYDPSGSPIKDPTPIEQLQAKMTESRVKNVEQADIYRSERAAKFAMAREVTGSGEEGAQQYLSALSGEHTKVEIDPLQLPQDDVNNLYDTIMTDPKYATSEKAPALTGLQKLRVGKVPQNNEIDALAKYFGIDIDDDALAAGPKGMATDLLDKFADFAGKTTRAVLGFHIPETAYSFHGINEGVRNTIFGPTLLGTPGRALESAYYLARPSAANDYLQTNMADLDRAITDGGLRVMTGDVKANPLWDSNNFLARGLNYITDPKNLFQQVIPAFKLKAYQKYLQQMTDAGVPYQDAAQIAGYNTNNQFGGINYTGWFANETNRKLFRATALAPDWMASNYRLGVGMANTLTNPLRPENRMYAVGIANLLGSYAGLNVLNSLETGHPMWENDIGHEMDVAYGQDEKGRTRYLSPYGTAMDMVRLPLGIAHAALTGKVGQAFQDMRSRISEPLQFATDMITNSDYAGKPIYDKTRYGKPISIGRSGLNIGTDLIDHIAPVGAQALVDYSEGKISEEELVTKLLQAPVRYKFPSRSGDQ